MFCSQRTANDRLKDWGIVLSNKKKPIQSMNTSSGGSVPSAPRANEAIQNDDSGPREGMSELGAMHEPHLEGFEPSNDMQMRRGELSTPSTPMQLHETTDAMATLSHAATTKNTMSQQGSTSQPQLESSEQSEDLQNQRGVPPSPPPLHMTANSTTNFSSTATPMNLDGNYPESQQLMSGPTIDASQRQDENHPLNQPRGTIRPHDMHINSEIQRQMMMCQEAKESYNRAKREWDYLLALVAGLEKQVDELKASDSSNKAEIHRLETQLYRAREDVKALRIKNRQATTRHGQKLENTRKEYEKERRQLESLKLSYEAVKKSHDEACRLWQTPVPTDSGVAMDSPTSYLLASPNILMPVRVEELTEPPSSLDRVGRGRPLNSDNAKKDALTALIKELDILVKTGRGEHLPDSQDAANRMDSSRQEWL
ncbi:hypothetical protein DL98DRAFT_208980 [Cadophora sp. DSE1049]|nr:hypothetical protein DL98DRAFT_208980 [Cadophora sp. DSE1049]